MDFRLHERLAAGGFEITRMHGCRILLKNETNFPWLMIVPEVSVEIQDLHQLDEENFAEVMKALRMVSRFVMDYFQPEKLNVACIGNIVRQMHIHVVGRSSTDPAWPGVVWAFEGKSKYRAGEAEEIIRAGRLVMK
ncbi:MAG: HIT family protein [Armatimonadetes bacterium]|nr:HIT family protein [Akkermansiaceae bacterium]